MTTCQTITVDFEEEMKNTRKLLERVPLDEAHRGYKPHEKSMAMDRLASHVAEIPSWIPMVLEAEVFELPVGFQPRVVGSTEELLALFDENAEKGRAGIAAASDQAMTKDWTFRHGTFSMTSPRPQVIRSFVNHLVHHRAQLGVYLRLNGIPVPGMYGPSADDWPEANQ